MLADLYVTDVQPSRQAAVFAFCFGFALQVVDDIQDMQTDARDGQQTLLTVASDPRRPIRRLCHLLRLLLPEDGSVAQRGMRAMCYTMVLKQVSRVRHLFDPSFLDQCERFCPIPLDGMARLAGMRTLLKMVREGKL